MLAHRLRVPEVEIMHALKGDAVRELEISRWEELIRAFEPLGNVHVIASNGATPSKYSVSLANSPAWTAF